MTESTNTCDVPARITLSLIRDFEVRRDGDPIEIPRNSQRVVCFLAFQQRPVRRSYVSGTLWDNSEECRASASLRSALWRLPSLPGFNIVCASQTHVWIHPKVSIDLRDVLDHSVAVLSSRHSDEELIDVSRALVSFGDDVLVGWYDDWVTMERERFRQIRLHALDRIGERLLEAGRFCDALQVGLAAARAEPLRESAHRLLVRVHLCEGNVAEAVRQYRSFADLTFQELGTRPSPVMEGLLRPYLAHASGS